MHLCIPPWLQVPSGYRIEKCCVLRREQFIRSERLMNIRGSLNGEWSVHTLGNGLAHSVGEAAFADVFIINLAGYSDNLTLCQIIGCGNSASRSERINPFPTKRINIFPFKAPAQNHYPGGMHKCIPYELFVSESTIMLLNTDRLKDDYTAANRSAQNIFPPASLQSGFFLL